MSTVTWANATRGKSAPWHMRQPGAAIWPSVDDQLGITPRHHQILPAAYSRAENAFPQLKPKALPAGALTRAATVRPTSRNFGLADVYRGQTQGLGAFELPPHD